MKPKSFSFVFLLLLISSATFSADIEPKEIPLHEVTGNSRYKPADSPDQSSDDPPRPNQFHAYIAGQTLIFNIENSNLNHLIVYNNAGTVSLTTEFVGDMQFVLATTGIHILKINNGSLAFVGEFEIKIDEQPYPTYTLNTFSEGYIIDIDYPTFEIREKTLPDEEAIDRQKFNYLKYHASASQNLCYYGMTNGQPELPFIAIELPIPDNARIDTITQFIEYYEDILLKYPYAPVQDVLQIPETQPLQFDEDYYSGKVYNEWAFPVEISEPYNTAGKISIYANMRPVCYFPVENILKPVRRQRFVVNVSEEASLFNIRTTSLDTEQPMYNVLGVPIDESYKGIIIQNGEKYIIQ